jgi:hypothetical protein
MNIFIHVLAANTLFLIFTSSVVLHGAPKVPSKIFQQQPSCIYPLPEVIYHWQLSFPNNSNHFLHKTCIITFQIMSVIMLTEIYVSKSVKHFQICPNISLCIVSHYPQCFHECKHNQVSSCLYQSHIYHHSHAKTLTHNNISSPHPRETKYTTRKRS